MGEKDRQLVESDFRGLGSSFQLTVRCGAGLELQQMQMSAFDNPVAVFEAAKNAAVLRRAGWLQEKQKHLDEDAALAIAQEDLNEIQLVHFHGCALMRRRLPLHITSCRKAARIQRLSAMVCDN